MAHRLKSMTPIMLNPNIFNKSLLTSLLQFWLPPYPKPAQDFAEADVGRWFARNPAVDQQCQAIAGPALSAISPTEMPLPEFESPEADRKNHEILSAPFVSLLGAQESNTEPASSLLPAHRALAITILLDQMPRNIFRDEAQKVVYTHYDRIARAVTAHVLAKGLDRDPSLASIPLWRMWFYLPLEHSEVLEDHHLLRERLAEMAEQARDRLDETGETMMTKALEVEERHYAPLKTFGRYPWRNRWLGRESTAEEEKWLREGGDTFGTG